MKVVLSGGEKGTYRSILLENGVTAIAFNITQYAIPKRKETNLAELLGGAAAYVYTSDEDEDVAKFDEFIRQQAEAIECVIGRPDYNGEWLGSKYVPLWNDPEDLERLAYLCEKHGRVAISDRALNAKTIPRINQLKQRWGCFLVGMTSKVDMIEAVKWDAVVVSSWTSVVRFGETQVWDGHGLRRYPAQKKESARKKHRPDIVRLIGPEAYEAVMEDDVKEVARLAVKSWQAWEEKTFGTPSTAAYHPLGEDDDEAEYDPNNSQIVANSPSTALASNPVPATTNIAITPILTRHASEKKLLPVLGLETIVDNHVETDSEGNEIGDFKGDDTTVIRYVSNGIRNCDSCYLAPRCPEFREHAECAFELPVEIKTKAQLRAVINAMITMQASRIFFAKLGEEMEGQGMDPALSSEMDRFFRMVQSAKDIEDTRDLIKFNMEARSSAGVLNRIFGKTPNAAPVATPITAGELDRVILEADVLD